ncbi:MAG: hypothetical protein A2X17_05050 [Bacteroidetes bacterium GWF2_41_61]|nr:MAG: hypothetical protein A2X17_05050 [Bacteroidetes bacterium GWF2_41_61]OFY91375.1 MAG: hypothetical protein A2266_09315 [Bacteroidetes bacterium RIFOXYA12_FULL_40_10]HBG23860.1 DUF349 domain-containing protein [Rikenellaceae bacterium]
MTQEINNSAPQEQFEEIKTLENTTNTDSETINTDFSELSLKEIIQNFQDLLERRDQHEMYKFADSIKAAFYKTLKKEKIAAGMTLPVHDEKEDEESSEENIVSSNPFAELERGFKELYNRYKVERTSFLQVLERNKEDNLRQKNEIIDELKGLLDKQEDLQHTFPSFRELQNRWKMVGPVPQANSKDLWDTYQFLIEKFYDFVKINNELRDLDLKKNLEIKTDLCEKAEQLMDEPNVVQAFRKLQKYHEEWRELGPVPKELREEIWNRFKLATSNINKRQQDHFEGLKEDQKSNLDLKTSICERAEAIAATEGDDRDWNALSKSMENLQIEWKGIGFASKKDNQRIYDRFRAACDKFYNAKRDYYSNFKKVMQDNLDKKLALCEQAEALKGSEDWKKTTDQLIAMQKRWKEIGPVARKQSDLVWKRFRAACDLFFENKAKHFSTVEESYDDNLKKKQDLIDEINAFKPETKSAENLEALKDFQQRWNEIGYVPLKDKERIQAAYRHAVDVKFADVRSSDNENKLVRFRKHIKELQSSTKGDRGIKVERDKLLQKFRQLEQDIALLENNKGFFAKSKNADSIFSDIDKKISIAREELVQIEEKIKLIDKQYE